MTRKRLSIIFISLLISIFSLFSLTGCNTNKIEKYSLHAYEYENTMFNKDDSFYGVKLVENLVTLELKNGDLVLTMSKALTPYVAHEYVTYTGTYTETETEINALILDISTDVIKITKAGALLSLKLPNGNTIILEQ